MTANKNHGLFVWHELMTTDPKAAITFYTDVVGWKTQAFGEAGDNAYMMWVASQGPLGGTMELPQQARQMGAPPHWVANVLVSDVDATVEQAKKLGGKVLREAETMPSVGRFALIQDPQGAHLSVFTPSGDMAPHDVSKPGEFSWNELMTSDHNAAFTFYNKLFGWEKLASHDMGPMGEYLIYGAHGRQLGGMASKTKDMPMPTAWMYYIHVDGLDAAVERAKKGGGKVLNGPMDVPGGDRIAQLMDPQGAAFALHETVRK